MSRIRDGARFNASGRKPTSGALNGMRAGIDRVGAVNFSSFIESRPDDAPGPEELLIEREELEAAGLEEPELERRRLPVTRRRLHELLEGLPAQEREALVGYYAGEQTQAELAARAGISQPSMHLRIHRAIKRLKWQAGPGSWFTAEDIERELAGVLEPRELRALIVYWRTTERQAVVDELGLTNYMASVAIVRRALEKVPRRFARGFAELARWGKRVLASNPQKPVVEPSALDAFLATRCVFHRSARVASVTLVAAYERFALERGRPVVTPALFQAVRARGARLTVVRVPWEPAPVSGCAGVRLTSDMAA